MPTSPPASSLLPPASEPSSPASPNDDDVLVKVENVSKIFCRDLKKSLKYGVQDSLGDLFSPKNHKNAAKRQKRSLRPGEFYAVKDASFELRRGECLGLIGKNGAGKTTLLKMLNGLIKPDCGTIEMRGRVGAMIALGAGFNPLLTGRENIYINGSILGFSQKEIDDKFDGIVEFAEIESFIDSPVQNYSSGMQVRLGFAIATAIEPEILIIDEVLAVGDSRFKAKSLARLSQLLKNSSVIFVSHEESHVQRICDRCLFLENGFMRALGQTNQVLSLYSKLKRDQEITNSDDQCHTPDIESVKLEIQNPSLARGEAIEISFLIHALKYLRITEVRVAVYRDGKPLAVAIHRDLNLNCRPGQNLFSFRIQPNCFCQANYALKYYLLSNNGKEMIASGSAGQLLSVEPEIAVFPDLLLDLEYLDINLDRGNQ